MIHFHNHKKCLTLQSWTNRYVAPAWTHLQKALYSELNREHLFKRVKHKARGQNSPSKKLQLSPLNSLDYELIIMHFHTFNSFPYQ